MVKFVTKGSLKPAVRKCSGSCSGAVCSPARQAIRTEQRNLAGEYERAPVRRVAARANVGQRSVGRGGTIAGLRTARDEQELSGAVSVASNGATSGVGRSALD